MDKPENTSPETPSPNDLLDIFDGDEFCDIDVEEPVPGGDDVEPSQPIPDKKHFKIGEAATIVGVKPYILRYWESEFKALQPRKTSTRHRLYTRPDIDLLLLIKDLLYEQMYTIAGARKRLAELQESGAVGGVSEGPSELMGEDPLAGTRVELLEQELQLMAARLDAALKERSDAMEGMRLATDALREVELAHEASCEEVETLQTLVRDKDRVHQVELDGLMSDLGEARMELTQLREEREQLLTAPPAPASPEPTGGDAPDLDDARRAQNEALANSRQTEHDLRNKLRYQISQKQRVLKELRSEVVSMMDLVQAAAE